MARQIHPSCWLMTDERMGGLLWPALEAAAKAGAGIVFRHHRTPTEQRVALAREVSLFARRYDLVLAVSRDIALARHVGADLVHNPEEPLENLPFSRAVHDEAEAHAARADGAALVFVSPVYPTRSHPGAAAIGEQEAARLAALAGLPAYALGGVTEDKKERLAGLGFDGWAAIDLWLGRAERGRF